MTACESVCVGVKCSLTLSTCLSNELALQQNVRQDRKFQAQRDLHLQCLCTMHRCVELWSIECVGAYATKYATRTVNALVGYVQTYTFSKRSVFEKKKKKSFEKIRFGVSTRIVRQSGDPVHTDVDWSKKTCLTWKSRPLCSVCWQRRTRLELKSHFFVCFLCLPVSLFCIASCACAPRKKWGRW